MGGNRRAARHRVAVALVGAGIIVSIFWTVVPAPQRLLLHPPPAPGRPAIRRPPPKPLFRPEYSEALRDLQAMEAPEAAALESKLQNETLMTVWAVTPGNENGAGWQHLELQ